MVKTIIKLHVVRGLIMQAVVERKVRDLFDRMYKTMPSEYWIEACTLMHKTADLRAEMNTAMRIKYGLPL